MDKKSATGSEKKSRGSEDRNSRQRRFKDMIKKHTDSDKGPSKSVNSEFQTIVRQERTFRNFLKQQNIHKNRYPDIILYDQNRINLKVGDKLGGDYYHASHVDGYKQPSAYILAQAPMAETETDFWRMVWQNSVSVIVLLTAVEDVNEAGKKGCIDFWPQTGNVKYLDPDRKLQVKTLAFICGPGYDHYKIEVIAERGKHHHKLSLIQYHRWREDDKIPDHLPKLVSKCRLLYSNKNPKDSKSPMMVVCSSGAIRSGTFAALDICIRRLNAEKEINVKGTVQCLQTQRFGIFSSPSHYLFLHRAIVDHATEHGLLDGPGEELDLATFSSNMRHEKK